MKKTIAKMMTAAMLLSAIPAVSLPTLTANAASPTAVTVSWESGNAVYGDYDGTYAPASIQVDEGAASQAFSKFEVSGNAKDFISDVKVENDGQWGELRIYTTGDASKLASLVKEGKNTFSITAAFSGNISTKVVNNDTYTDSTVEIGSFYIGGAKEVTADGKTAIENWAASSEDADKWLWDSDWTKAYVKVLLDGSGEVTVAKSDDLDLKDNDDLRGQTLELNEIYIGGFLYPVTKFGAQALKEAHMKKLVAENVKKVGKGAFRKCKQVKKVDISDSNKVRKIHSKAFYGDKNLKTIAIDGRKLNTVGSGAFSGVKKNCNIKIKAKKTKYNSDVKLIKKSGAKNVKFTRVAP